MTTEALKNLAAEAAAVAPPIYEEIKVLFGKATAGEPIADADVARLVELIAALKSPDKYFDEGFAVGVVSATPPAPASLNFIR